MSTDELNLTLKRQPLAASASADGTSHEQEPAVTAISKASRRYGLRRLPQAGKPAAATPLRETPADPTPVVVPLNEQASSPSDAAQASNGLPIVILTTDTELAAAIEAAVAEQHAVMTVGSVEQAALLAARGRCPILITDQALTQPALVRITAPLRTHEPALVTVAVGNRGDDNALIGLLSAGAADRLMLKPVTPALARIVIESAVREHRAQKASNNFLLLQRDGPTDSGDASIDSRDASIETIEKPASMSRKSKQLARSADRAPTLTEERQSEAHAAPVSHTAVATPVKTAVQRPPWIAVIAALAVVGFVAWWLTSRQLPDIDPRAVIATNLAAAREALADARYLEPSEHSAFHHFNTVLTLEPANAEARAGIDRIANRYIEDAQSLLGAGKLADAGLSLERARRVNPEDPRLLALDSELRAKINGLLIQAHAFDARIEALPREQLPKVAATKPIQEKSSTRANVESSAGAAVVQQPKPNAPTATDAEEYVEAPAPAVEAIALNQPDAANKLIEAAQGALGVAVPVSAQAAASQADPSANAATASSAPKLIKFVQPDYPNEALMRGFEGWVSVGLDVTPAGDVINPRIEDGSTGRLFHRAALVAVRQWKYEQRADSDATQHLQVRLEFKVGDRR
jgi:TonB family protein